MTKNVICLFFAHHRTLCPYQILCIGVLWNSQVQQEGEEEHDEQFRKLFDIFPVV